MRRDTSKLRWEHSEKLVRRTWRKRKGLATKLLGNPASSTSAHVTTGFATGHAAPSAFEIPHCKARRSAKSSGVVRSAPPTHRTPKPNKQELSRVLGSSYVFDGLEGERGVAEEDAGGPGALGVGAAAAGGGRVRKRWPAREKATAARTRSAARRRGRPARRAGAGSAPAVRRRRRRRPRGRRHWRRLEMESATCASPSLTSPSFRGSVRLVVRVYVTRGVSEGERRARLPTNGELVAHGTGTSTGITTDYSWICSCFTSVRTSIFARSKYFAIGLNVTSLAGTADRFNRSYYMHAD